MRKKIIVFFILVCSFVLFQQCATVNALKNTTSKKKKEISNNKAKLDSLLIYKDSVRHYKGLLLKAKEIKPKASQRDTLILTKIQIDSNQLSLFKDSLKMEQLKVKTLSDSLTLTTKILSDSLALEKEKLLMAYLKSDTLVLRTKQMFEAKILSLQKNNNPNILYKLVPYEVIKKDLKAVIITALSVCLISFVLFFCIWKMFLYKKNNIEIVPSENEKKILEDLQNEEFHQ